MTSSTLRLCALLLAPSSFLGCDPAGVPAPGPDASPDQDSAVSPTDAGAPPGIGGEVLWEFPIAGWGASPAVGPDGTIFFAQVTTKDYGAGSVFALNRDGSVKWEFEMPAHASERVCGEVPMSDVSEWEAACNELIGGGVWAIEPGPGGVLYAGQAMYSPENRDEVRHVFAIDQADGSERWRFPIGSRNVFTHFAIDSAGNIYFGATTPRSGTAFHAITPDGEELWTHVVETEGSYPGSPLVIGDTVVFGGDRIRAFRSGVPAWTVETASSAWLYAPAADADGRIFVLSPADLHLHVLDVDGNALSRVNVGFTETTPIIGDDGAIYLHNYPEELFERGADPVGGLPAGIHALEPDLSVRWSAVDVMRSDDPDWAPSSGITGSDSIMALGPRDTLYVGSEHGSIYALREGAVLWERRLFSEFDMRLVYTDGLVLACQNGFIRFESDSARCYAIRAGE